MSIITTVEAVPSRLFSIYESLFDSETGETKDRIEAWATPPSLNRRSASEDGGSSTKLFSSTLLEARKLGLVEDADEKIRITLDARGGGKKGADREARFRSYLRRTLFDPVRATETQQDGFMLALAWFLSANPLEPMNFSDRPQKLLEKAIGEHASKTELTSNAPFQNFLYWARYLGFATIVGGRDTEESGSRRVFPDPIRAIASALPTIFADDAELMIESFMNRLSMIFPVFEGGSVRQAYEAMLREQPDDTGLRLSIATSIALRRLSDRQKITLTKRSDAPPRILDFGVGKDSVSRVAWRNAA
jgi:hypothetical protein